jgi:hypothetical protein
MKDRNKFKIRKEKFKQKTFGNYLYSLHGNLEKSSSRKKNIFLKLEEKNSSKNTVNLRKTKKTWIK